ncbi:MAG TPA: class I SAM-dependent methyltransferase [Candidatus Paceibacterota bacterium]|nr:class I SAM-dependent methyltransferase [Candidatus Paceibacterota bacterium]HPY12740.1 class I SAM-dependent methyltransferase [Candidatus Paceibacterota bacterium]HQB26819.1 class I SAM-dependent methyltransferase [Candidatus Paceibacterota bacterium]
MEPDHCPLCYKDKLVDYVLGDKRILKCSECGVVFLNFDLFKKKDEDYYENNIFYAINAEVPTLVETMRASAKFYLKIVKKYVSPPARLTDVGANCGVLVAEAASQGFSALGLEKNKFLIDKSKKAGLLVMDKDLSDEAIEKADIITAMHVLEHLAEPRAFVKSAYKKLKPGGVLAISVPNLDSFLARKDGLSWRYVALEHLFYFSEKVLWEVLREEGFEILGSFQDGTNLSEQGIKKLLHYLWGRPLVRDRFQPKSFNGRSKSVPTPCWAKRILKKILIVVIKILKREDFVMVIAQKPK